MSLVKKLKDILFEEEEYTEPLNVREEVKKEETSKIVKIEPIHEEVKEVVKEPVQEREIPEKIDNSFQFPDFDEEEFVSNMSKNRSNTNVLEYERKKASEKRNEYSRLERVDNRELVDKKKFKPSPIISPVYGILNQDYKAEDIVNRQDVASNISIEEVRKKAFETKKEEVVKKREETISEPVVTFFEEKDSLHNEREKDNYKSIDALLEDASSEISLEDTLEMPVANNLDAIEEELEKLDTEEPSTSKKDLDDTLDSDLFELIDSMYDDREEAE